MSNNLFIKFENTFKCVNENNYLLDVELFLVLADGFYYNNFLNYINDKITKYQINNNFINIHINAKNIKLFDFIDEQKAILKFVDLLYKFIDTITIIYIYESTYIFTQIINLIIQAIGIDIRHKLVYIDKFNLDKFNIQI